MHRAFEQHRGRMPPSHTVRVTGVLLHETRRVVVEQRMDDVRGGSLPGGKVEAGETLEEALLREMREETGLDVRITLIRPEDLPAYGISEIWGRRVAERFPGTPRHAGHKRNMGLGGL